MKHLVRSSSLCFLFISLTLVIAFPSFAQDTAQEAPPWKGTVELSYIETSGNTDSQTFLGASKVERTFESSKLTGEIRGIYGERKDLTSDKSWFGTLKYDKNITERTYGYLSETIERNTLKGIEARYITMAGLGYYFIKTATDTLKGEVGLGYTRENQVSPFADRGFPVARAFAGYSHSFDEKTRFDQTVEYIPNLKESKSYLINEESAFVTNLMGNLAFKVSYAIFYNNLPPDELKKYDRLFRSALLYTF
ncbi:MAG: DUF481 domain-containing protein [Candidatus Manganitrophaceae bacterium]